MSHSRTRAMVIYAMWGALLFISTWIMEVLPNIHLLALFIIVLTRVYRVGALIPIYVYVFLAGALRGFSPWWIPYLYVWTALWAVTMLLPGKMPDGVAAVCYCILGCLHGLLFEVLWVPFYMTFEGLTFHQSLIRLTAGVGFSITHGVSNAVACTMAIPLIRLVERLEK